MDPKAQRNSFTKNVVTLLTGTVISQALPIAAMPVLTRLYSPSDFGVLATFVAIITVLGVIANARYELAIVLPEKEEDAINLVALGLLIACALSFIAFIFIVFFGSKISILIGSKDIWWLYLIPLSLILSGLYNVLNYYNIRVKAYKDISISNVYKGIMLAGSQIIFGLLSLNKFGLILGQFLSQLFANIRLVKNVWGGRGMINLESMKRNAKRFSDFPKYSVWGVFSNSLAYNSIQLVIPIIYNLTTLGYYSIVQKLLGIPSNLIGTSVGQVYFQEANKEKQLSNKCSFTFVKTLKKLLIISISMFVPLYFLCELLFKWFLGEGWDGVYQYAQILMPMFATRFIAASLSNTTNIFEKQKLALFLQIILLFLCLSTLGTSILLEVDILIFLKILSIVLTIYYSCLIYILYRISKGEV